MTPKCTCRIGTYLSSLLYFCAWYGHCSLQESMILPESERTLSVCQQCCSEFFFANWDSFCDEFTDNLCPEKLIFFRMIQMIWELSSWYRLSAEGLQSVQNIWKVSGWNKKCSQIIKRIQILYDKTTHDLQSVWIWNLKFLRSARTSLTTPDPSAHPPACPKEKFRSHI